MEPGNTMGRNEVGKGQGKNLCLCILLRPCDIHFLCLSCHENKYREGKCGNWVKQTIKNKYRGGKCGNLVKQTIRSTQECKMSSALRKGRNTILNLLRECNRNMMKTILS